MTIVNPVPLTLAVRNSFLQPVSLVMMMIRFHALVENQPINEARDARLSQISDKFRNLGQGMAAAR